MISISRHSNRSNVFGFGTRCNIRWSASKVLRSLVVATVVVWAGNIRAQQVAVTITAPAVAPGEVAMASILVDSAIGLAGADIAIDLPEFVSAGAAHTASSTADFLIASQYRSGRVDISLAGANGLGESESTILQIPLAIAKSAPAGVFALKFSRLQVYDSTPAAIPARAFSGSIEVALPGDSDEDGLPDAWEVQHFGNLAAHPAADSDRDGSSDHHEFLAGTDPASADSVFRIHKAGKVNHSGGQAPVIQWEGHESRTYEIQWSNGPVDSNMTWHNVYNPSIRKEGSIHFWIDDGTRTHNWSNDTGERYYRIVVAPHEN